MLDNSPTHLWFIAFVRHHLPADRSSWSQESGGESPRAQPSSDQIRPLMVAMGTRQWLQLSGVGSFVSVRDEWSYHPPGLVSA